jgi:hypothetical protein
MKCKDEFCVFPDLEQQRNKEKIIPFFLFKNSAESSLFAAKSLSNLA